MNVIVEILLEDPAWRDVKSAVQGVLRVGMSPVPSRPIPATGDVLYLVGMDLVVVKAVYDWDSPESPTVVLIVYPAVPIESVDDTYWQIMTLMKSRASQNLPPVIEWVIKDWE